MKKRMAAFGRMLVAVVALVALAGCEQIFTNNFLTGLQRDISNLSPEQQLAFARNALQSGDTEAMREAYEALRNSDDPATQALAGELALGASGLVDALTGAALEGLSGTSDPAAVQAELDSLLAGVDTELLEASGTLTSDALAGGATVSGEQQILAGAGLVLAAAEETDTQTIDSLETTADSAIVAQAQAGLDLISSGSAAIAESGSSTEIIDSITSGLTGMEL
jgi:hypothetical protein